MLDLAALDGRVAAAPISWGVCEVPGWGAMLPASRVLPEMRSVGLAATELGAPGFLPDTADELRTVLDEHCMSLVGGFVPLVLHDRERWGDALERARATADLFLACGATRFVTAVVLDYDWPRPLPLDAEGMKVLGEGLGKIDELLEGSGLVQVLHPHVDTLVETSADVELALEHTSVRWCLDTGHLRIGGVDPVQFAREAGHRVAHAHLKDVDTSVAAHVLSRERSLLQGVQAGLFRAFGDGDVAVDEVVLELERQGYGGWYVLEQDTALTDGIPREGEGPLDDVRQCLGYLARSVVPYLPLS